MPGYRSHELQRCIEREGSYLLLVRWDSVAAHEEGFRKSPQYQDGSGSSITSTIRFRPCCITSRLTSGRAHVIPPKERLTICFAHAAYQLQEHFVRRETGIESFEVRTREEFEKCVGDADVVVVSGFGATNSSTARRAFDSFQSISAGTDQFDREKFARRV
jgi:hypothetical protein